MVDIQTKIQSVSNRFWALRGMELINLGVGETWTLTPVAGSNPGNKKVTIKSASGKFLTVQGNSVVALPSQGVGSTSVFTLSKSPGFTTNVTIRASNNLYVFSDFTPGQHSGGVHTPDENDVWLSSQPFSYAFIQPGFHSQFVAQSTTAFLPTLDGFHFNNDPGSVPDNHPDLPIVGVPIPGMIAHVFSDAGICGGMVYAALDFFLSQAKIPTNSSFPTSPDDPLLNFILRRFVDSLGFGLWAPILSSFPVSVFLNVLAGILPNDTHTYVTWLLASTHNTELGDLVNSIPIVGSVATAAAQVSITSLLHAEGIPVTFAGSIIAGMADTRGLAERMLTEEWPAVRAELDAGHPVPLGLVIDRTPGPLNISGIIGALGVCHQVLAWGYTIDDGDVVTIKVYDPNDHDNNGSVIKFSISDNPDFHTVSLDTPDISNHSGGDTFKGFFKSRMYRRQSQLITGQ